MMNKALLTSVALVILTACTGTSPPPSQAQDSEVKQDQGLDRKGADTLPEDRPAPALPAERFPVVSKPGFEQARDVALFAQRQQTVSAPAPGLDAPEAGTGEYAAGEWKLPASAGEAAPAETLPQPAQVDDVVSPSNKTDEAIPYEQVVEDIVHPIRIVEEIPLTPNM